MATAKLKSIDSTLPEKISAADALTAITLTVLRARNGATKPTLGDVAKTTTRAVKLLGISDPAERQQTENAAVLALAKQFDLLGSI